MTAAKVGLICRKLAGIACFFEDLIKDICGILVTKQTSLQFDLPEVAETA